MMAGILNPIRKRGAQTALGWLILIIAACAPLPRTPQPSPPPLSAQPTRASDPSLQPDLIISFTYLEMEGRHGGCVNAYSPYGIRVQIKNIGSAASGFFLVDLNGSTQQVGKGLQAGQFIELHFAGTLPSGLYEVTVDAAQQVAESREDNNTQSFRAPTPTPPPLCPATGTPTP